MLHYMFGSNNLKKSVNNTKMGFTGRAVKKDQRCQTNRYELAVEIENRQRGWEPSHLQPISPFIIPVI